jgi:hypothetical protein
MHKSATKCNETIGKWCKNKHGASKIIDMFETYQQASKLGDAQGAPSSSTKISGHLSRHYIFIASYAM